MPQHALKKKGYSNLKMAVLLGRTQLSPSWGCLLYAGTTQRKTLPGLFESHVVQSKYVTPRNLTRFLEVGFFVPLRVWNADGQGRAEVPPPAELINAVCHAADGLVEETDDAMQAEAERSRELKFLLLNSLVEVLWNLVVGVPF